MRRVRDDLRACVLEHSADPGAVLVVDEPGPEEGQRRRVRVLPGPGRLPGIAALLVRVAGSQWTIEDGFAAGHHQGACPMITLDGVMLPSGGLEKLQESRFLNPLLGVRQ